MRKERDRARDHAAFTKGGQDQALGVMREAGARDGAAAKLQSQLGVEMPRYLGPRLVRTALVAQNDAIDAKRVGDRPAPRPARQPVVIAGDPDEFGHRRQRAQPIRRRRRDALVSGSIMKTVAETPDGSRARPPRQIGQAVERVLAVIGRQRLTVRRVPARLFQMQVGDDQRPVPRPEQRPFGKQVKGLAGKVEGGRGRHRAAMARYPAAGKRRGPIALLAPARRIVERETLAGLAVRPARQIEDDAAVGEIDLDPVKQ